MEYVDIFKLRKLVNNVQNAKFSWCLVIMTAFSFKQIKEAKTKALKEKNEFIRDLLVATDTFIIDRPAFKTKSILARISLVFRLGT